MGLGTLFLGYFMLTNSTVGTENLSFDISVDAVGLLLIVSAGIMLKTYSARFYQVFNCAAALIPISVFFTVYQLKLLEVFNLPVFGTVYHVLQLGWILLLWGFQDALFKAIGEIANTCELFVLESRLKICARIFAIYAWISTIYWILCFIAPNVFDPYSFYIQYLLYDLIIFYQSVYLFKAWREIVFV